MTALQLNAELFKELSYIADNESYIVKVLNYIRGLRQNQNTITDSKAGIEEDLEELFKDFSPADITEEEILQECKLARAELYNKSHQ